MNTGVCVHCLLTEENRCHCVQPGVCFRRVEVGQLVARKPGLGVAHVTQISVSPVFLSVPQPGAISLFGLFWGLIERYFIIVDTNSSPSTKVFSCRCWCSVAVRMQQLGLKVLCSTLLLLAVVPSVYSQSGTCFTFIFLLYDHLCVFYCLVRNL